MIFEPTKEALEFIHGKKEEKGGEFLDSLKPSYYVENDKDLEEVKQFIIKQIATNPIKYINLHRLGDLVTDKIYND